MIRAGGSLFPGAALRGRGACAAALALSLLAACGDGGNSQYSGASGGGAPSSSGGGCGGSGGRGGSGGGSGGAAPSVVATVDNGPAAAQGDVNILFVSVNVCAPGTATCQLIDHVQVDTGSTGFRVLAQALGAGLASDQLEQVSDDSGNPIVECTQFADGYSWGPVKLADLTIGSATIGKVPIQVIGDATYSSRTIPSACSSNVDQPENTVLEFGANGLLGIGNFLQDCGSDCASGTQDGSAYNICPASSAPACQPAALAVAAQVQNPIAMLSSNNNGVVVQLPAVGVPGAATTSGSLIFGVGTASNNALAQAGVYALDEYGNFSTTVSAVGTFNESFIDSGSDGYFFNDSALAACAGNESDFYCPASPTSLSATITGLNGATANLSVTIENAAAAFDADDSAVPGLAGSAGSGLGGNTFDWGLPFFFGRTVYVGFEGDSAAGTSVVGPFVAF